MASITPPPPPSSKRKTPATPALSAKAAKVPRPAPPALEALPEDALAALASFTGPRPLACKGDLVPQKVAFEALFDSYRKEPHLNPYVEEACRKFEDPKERVQHLWNQLKYQRSLLPPSVKEALARELSPAQTGENALQNLETARVSKIAEYVTKQGHHLTAFFSALRDQVMPQTIWHETMGNILALEDPLQKIAAIREWIQENKRWLSRLINLDLTDKGLTYLPPELALCSKLTTLRLGNNPISHLDSELFSHLPLLQTLILNRCRLTTLTTALSKNEHLTTLELQNNAITTIEKGALRENNQLTNLYLEGNPLTDIPPAELTPLTKLQLFRCDEKLKEAARRELPSGTLLRTCVIRGYELGLPIESQRDERT